MKKKPNKRKKNRKSHFRSDMMALLLFTLSIVTLLQLGRVGQLFVFFFRFFFGEWLAFVTLSLAGLAVFFLIRRKLPKLLSRRFIGIYLIFGTILMFSHLRLLALLSAERVLASPSILRETWDLFWSEIHIGEHISLGGGMVGAIFLAMFYFLFSARGVLFVGMISILLGILLLTGKPLGELLGPIGKWLKKLGRQFFLRLKKKGQTRRKKKEAGPIVEIEDFTQVHEPIVTEPIIENFAEEESGQLTLDLPRLVEKEEPTLTANDENRDCTLPPIDLLQAVKNKKASTDQSHIYENAKKLEQTFQSFNVMAKVTKVHMGPAVTKYEVYPEAGVKVSKIVSLTDDLALALAAKDIRMEAPIPGKSAIGIEVPNKHVATVSLREVLESKENNRQEDKLMVSLGRDVTGNAIFAHLNKMPHLLVAGATGSGKSVCINGIIVSILMRAKPHEVKLMMIDPKMVELNIYNDIPHLLAPVVTNPKKAAQALRIIVSEMERRYELFAHSGTRNIEGYNEFVGTHNKEKEEQLPGLPYIVVIVDELADLMMVASGDVEDAITRIAQMARAAGIHLIIATQRPSVDVITGVIKANIPSRIAFAVSSQVDSRTILDTAGAEKLLGRGDMLFMPIGASKPIRVQGAFLSDAEVEHVVGYVKSQQPASYQEEMIPTVEKETETQVEDELYDEAVQLVANMQTASVSMLQRRFRIGYARAARLIDTMEQIGVVGPYEGSKPREVLIPKPEENMQ